MAAAEATEAAAMAVLAAVRRVAGLVVLPLVAWAVMWAVMCATGAAATVRAEVAESIRTERL